MEELLPPPPAPRTTGQKNKKSSHLLLYSFHFGVTSCPPEPRSRSTACCGGIRLGPLVGPPGWGDEDLTLYGNQAVWGGASRRKGGGGVDIVAVVPAVTAAVGW